MRQADWLDINDDDTSTQPKRRPWLLIGAAVPWALVVALLMVNGSDDGDGLPNTEVASSDHGGDASADNADLEEAGDTDDANDTEVATEVAPDERSDRHAGPETHEGGSVEVEGPDGGSGESGLPANDPADQSLRIAELRGNWRVEAGVEEAAALAIVAARAWLTGVEPVLDDLPNAGNDGYAEHLVVEAVEYPAAEAAVVTVVAVLLEGDGQKPSVQRVAVPIVFTDDGPKPGGEPWALPGPSLEPTEPPRTVKDDPASELAAAEALDAAGLGELIALYETDGWPVIAEVSTDAGGEEDTTNVWLRPHRDGFVVAGTTLTQPESDADAAGAAGSEEPEQ